MKVTYKNRLATSDVRILFYLIVASGVIGYSVATAVELFVNFFFVAGRHGSPGRLYQIVNNGNLLI